MVELERVVGADDADAVELRVLGCLVEKQRTTPDAYPLTLNALRLACNQTTNRDPVVDYDEPTIRTARAFGAHTAKAVPLVPSNSRT